MRTFYCIICSESPRTYLAILSEEVHQLGNGKESARTKITNVSNVDEALQFSTSSEAHDYAQAIIVGTGYDKPLGIIGFQEVIATITPGETQI